MMLTQPSNDNILVIRPIITLTPRIMIITPPDNDKNIEDNNNPRNDSPWNDNDDNPTIKQITLLTPE